MALDSLYLQQLSKELKSLLRNSRVEKISQPHPLDAVLSLRTAQKSYRLFISAHPQYARINLTAKNQENPLKPPAFCMLLRKYLENARLLEINQPDFERIIRLYFQTVYPIDGISQIILVCELMGKHSNLILINRQNNQILGAAKILTSESNRYREIASGSPYVCPPKKTNPLSCRPSELLKAEGTLKEALQQNFSGMSPQIIQEIFYRCSFSLEQPLPLNDEQINSLEEVWQKIFTAAEEKPLLYLTDNGEILDYSYLKLEHLKAAETKAFPDGSQLLAFYYEQKQQADYLKQKKKDLTLLLQRELNRCRKKAALQKKDLAKAENAETYRIKGELLFANLGQIKKGARSVALNDYYTNQVLEIALNPEISPSANAQGYFKKYNKVKSSIKHLTEQLKLTAEEEEYLEGLLLNLEQAENQNDIDLLRSELEEENYLKVKQKNKSKKKLVINPLSFISSDGFIILVGKNNKENDQLTLKTAKSHDLWLHVKDIPGSHVIVRCNDKIPQTTLTEAAELAAYYSKSRYSSNVPVDYTLKKYVKKPTGAKPGMVIYTEQKTLFVTPNEEKIALLRKK